LTDNSEGQAFYSAYYSRLDDELSVNLRREVYGEDLGQAGWRTASEQIEFADFLVARPNSQVLDIACGSGVPSLALIERTNCQLTGIDIDAAGIGYAQAQATKRALADRATFNVLDCDARLPFEDGSFDAVFCIDSIVHFRNRSAVLMEWARLLRSGGRLVFTDLAVVTGAVSKRDLDIRTPNGFWLFVPPGLNERLIRDAGLNLLKCEDRSSSVAELAARWHAARARHHAELVSQEGTDGFEQHQEFFAMVADLADSRRLSRFLYVAEKPTSDGNRPDCHRALTPHIPLASATEARTGGAG
jgi:SAM-dependent methyltransferase